MASAQFRTEEIIGLGVAGLLHVGLFGALLMQPDDDEIVPLPERVTVSLAEDIGLEAASPDPVAESRLAVAPTLADTPTPDEVAESAPAPAPQAAPPPPRRQPRAAPPRARDTPRAQPPRRRPERPKSRPKPPKKPSGASRIGSDFLPGAGSSSETNETRAPTRKFGRTEQAALSQAIYRQLKPHWRVPQGVEVDRLVTIVSVRLNKDGTLASAPRILEQSGVTSANASQKARHAENATRAVRLVRKFKLPEDFYPHWRDLELVFDRRL